MAEIRGKNGKKTKKRRKEEKRKREKRERGKKKKKEKRERRGRRRKGRKEKKSETTVKHSCPSGLRGPSQERLSEDAWVRIPPDAFQLVKPACAN